MNNSDWVYVAIVFSANKELKSQQLSNILYLFRNLITPKYLPKHFYNDWKASLDGPCSEELRKDVQKLLKNEELLSHESKLTIRDIDVHKKAIDIIEHLPIGTKSYMHLIVSWVISGSHHTLIRSMTIRMKELKEAKV